LAFLAATLATALAGCYPEQERQQTFGPGFGNAVQNNMAVQVINPVPPATTTAPDYEGTRAAAAVERYRAGHVIPPASTSIGPLGGGGAPSGGGGGSAGVSAGTAPSQ
jgi:type IV pilus biogenesis protein CpaD/CtpE